MKNLFLKKELLTCKLSFKINSPKRQTNCYSIKVYCLNDKRPYVIVFPGLWFFGFFGFSNA